MLSIKGETGLALGERRGVTDGARGGTALGLRANILEGDNRRVGGGFGRERMSVALTIGSFKRNAQQSCLSKMDGRLGLISREPSSPL